MNIKSYLGVFCCCVVSLVHAQKPFGHEQAIHKDSSIFTAWATGCALQRGYQNIADPSSGYPTIGDETTPIGKALNNGVVSLGDGGSAILTFDKAIQNGEGYDFAVFENGFALQGDTLFYLELAFVEVSSDGTHYVRFASSSLTDTTTQADNATGTDPRKLHNLAGSYAMNYGTPFDLDELKDSAGVDVAHITHIKLTDVVGALSNTYARRDAAGRKINDPWPTPFASSGFDLGGIGVIHQQVQSGIADASVIAAQVQVYPVPASATDKLTIVNTSAVRIQQVELVDITGRVLYMQPFTGTELTLPVGLLGNGVYFAKLTTSTAVILKKIIIH